MYENSYEYFHIYVFSDVHIAVLLASAHFTHVSDNILYYCSTLSSLAFFNYVDITQYGYARDGKIPPIMST